MQSKDKPHSKKKKNNKKTKSKKWNCLVNYYEWLISLITSIDCVLVISNNIILLVWAHIVNVGFADISTKMIVSKKNANVAVISI
jgi:hypothetical protein